MGRDKRWLPVDGRPLLELAVAAVAAVTDEFRVVGGGATRPPGDHPTLEDEVPDVGPLGGLLTALRWAGQAGAEPTAGAAARAEVPAHAADSDDPLLLVVPADHPRLVPAVLRDLLDRLAAAPALDAVLLGTDRGPQPLVGAYRPRAATTVAHLLDAGERRATQLPSRLTTATVPVATWTRLDPDGHTARDLDTPEDVRVWRGRDAAGTVTSITTVRDDRPQDRREPLAVEEPLVIRVHGPGQAPAEVGTTMRTPGHEADLAVGWLHAEGLLQAAEVVDVRLGDPRELARPDDTVTVTLSHPVDLAQVTRRHAAATASCGVCGRASIDALASWCPRVPDEAPGSPLSWDVVASLPERLRAAQDLFAATGGVHATGLCTPSGQVVTVREDVGRHNALDAAIGAHVRAGDVPLHHLVAVLSGRIGFELVAKAAAAGLPVVVAVGAPTDLAVRTADRLGVTLVGFLRDRDGNVYTHPHRIALPTAPPEPPGARGRPTGTPDTGGR